MFFFRIHAVAEDDSPKKEAGWAGAYVQVWVNYQIESGAELLAMKIIEGDGWIPCETMEARFVTEGDYADEPEHLAHYEVAQEIGLSYETYAYPPEEAFR